MNLMRLFSMKPHSMNELNHRHVILVDYQPTVCYSQKITCFIFLKLQETESSFAEWFASDNL
jgi:6-pyruvoyltetrahydropterin/6-carboxytetrahydropterin synthase